MSTSSQVRSAWNTAVWQHATTQAITTAIFPYDLSASLKSKTEAVNLYYNGSINCFQYLVSRERKTDEIRAVASASRYIFTVQVDYVLQKDISDTAQNYNNVIDRLETIDGLVLSQLGKTWTSTVDWYEFTGIQVPKLITLDEKECWHGALSYRAFDHV